MFNQTKFYNYLHGENSIGFSTFGCFSRRFQSVSTFVSRRGTVSTAFSTNSFKCNVLNYDVIRHGANVIFGCYLRMVILWQRRVIRYEVIITFVYFIYVVIITFSLYILLKLPV